MSFQDPWFRDGKELSPLDWERRMFEQTKNPLHVWRAYEICSELMRGSVFHSESLPTWILDYFDTVADTIRELYYENLSGKVPASEIGTRVMEALKIKASGQGVRSTAYSDQQLARRDHRLALQVWIAKRDHPMRSIEQITDDVAETSGESFETVHKAWIAWRRFIHESSIPPRTKASR